MAPHSVVYSYRLIFSPSTAQEQEQNFADYWRFCQAQAGELLEAEQNLTRKKDTLLALQANPVRLRQPLPEASAFYRNYVRCQDELATLDRKTLLLTAMYKVARHEWVGITGAWEVTPPFSDTQHVITKISRYHLAEEFCHVRLFHEMFLTCQLVFTSQLLRYLLALSIFWLSCARFTPVNKPQQFIRLRPYMKNKWQ